MPNHDNTALTCASAGPALAAAQTMGIGSPYEAGARTCRIMAWARSAATGTRVRACHGESALERLGFTKGRGKGINHSTSTSTSETLTL
jgi:hypothetical protein